MSGQAMFSEICPFCSADGRPVDVQAALRAYCRFAPEADLQEIAAQMRLANLNTSFRFWHRYLHNCPERRVRGVFAQMAEDMEQLARG